MSTVATAVSPKVPTDVKTRKASPKVAKSASAAEVTPAVPVATPPTPVSSPSVELKEPKESDPDKFKRRKACMELGVHFPVARVRHVMGKAGINSAVLAAVEALPKEDPQYAAKVASLSQSKTRFSEKAFVATSLLIEKVVTPLLVNGFEATLANEHKTIGLEYLYTPGYEQSPFHHLLMRLPAYADQSNLATEREIEKRKNAALKEKSKLVEKEIKGKYTLTLKEKAKKKADKAAKADKADKPVKAEKPVAPVVEEAVEVEETEAESTDKGQFEYYIGKYCVVLKELHKQYTGLHVSKVVKKHVSDIIEELIALIARAAHELTVLVMNKTINAKFILAAVKQFLAVPTPLEEKFTFDEETGKVTRILVDNSTIGKIATEIEAIVEEYMAYIPSPKTTTEEAASSSE